MSEATIQFIINAAVYGAMGLGFFVLTNHAIRWYYRQMLKKIVDCIEPVFDLAKESTRQIHGIRLVQDEMLKTIEAFRADCEEGHIDMMEQFKALEEMIVMVHQDILYFDEELGQLDARIFRLEQKSGPTVEAFTAEIKAPPLPSSIETPLRRMRELRRRRR